MSTSVNVRLATASTSAPSITDESKWSEAQATAALAVDNARLMRETTNLLRDLEQRTNEVADLSKKLQNAERLARENEICRHELEAELRVQMQSEAEAKFQELRRELTAFKTAQERHIDELKAAAADKETQLRAALITAMRQRVDVARAEAQAEAAQRIEAANRNAQQLIETARDDANVSAAAATAASVGPLRAALALSELLREEADAGCDIALREAAARATLTRRANAAWRVAYSAGVVDVSELRCQRVQAAASEEAAVAAAVAAANAAAAERAAAAIAVASERERAIAAHWEGIADGLEGALDATGRAAAAALRDCRRAVAFVLDDMTGGYSDFIVRKKEILTDSACAVMANVLRGCATAVAAHDGEREVERAEWEAEMGRVAAEWQREVHDLRIAADAADASARATAAALCEAAEAERARWEGAVAAVEAEADAERWVWVATVEVIEARACIESDECREFVALVAAAADSMCALVRDAESEAAAAACAAAEAEAGEAVHRANEEWEAEVDMLRERVAELEDMVEAANATAAAARDGAAAAAAAAGGEVDELRAALRHAEDTLQHITASTDDVVAAAVRDAVAQALRVAADERIAAAARVAAAEQRVLDSEAAAARREEQLLATATATAAAGRERESELRAALRVAGDAAAARGAAERSRVRAREDGLRDALAAAEDAHREREGELLREHVRQLARVEGEYRERLRRQSLALQTALVRLRGAGLDDAGVSEVMAMARGAMGMAPIDEGQDGDGGGRGGRSRASRGDFGGRSEWGVGRTGARHASRTRGRHHRGRDTSTASDTSDAFDGEYVSPSRRNDARGARVERASDTDDVRHRPAHAHTTTRDGAGPDAVPGTTTDHGNPPPPIGASGPDSSPPAAAPAPVAQALPTYVTAVVVDAARHIVYTATGSLIHRWVVDMTGGRCAGVLRGHAATVRCLRLRPCGGLVSGGDDAVLLTWAAPTDLGATGASVRAEDSSPDPPLGTTGGAGVGQGATNGAPSEESPNSSVRLQQPSHVFALYGSDYFVLHGPHASSFRQVKQSGTTGLTFSGHTDHILDLLVVPTNIPAYPPTTSSVSGYTSAASTVPPTPTVGESHGASLFSSHGGPGAAAPHGVVVVSCGRDASIRRWDPQTGACLGVLRDHMAPIMSLLLAPSGHRVFSASLDGTVRGWATDTWRCVRVVPTLAVDAVALLSDDVVVTATVAERKSVEFPSCLRCEICPRLPTDFPSPHAFSLSYRLTTSHHAVCTHRRPQASSPAPLPATPHWATSDTKSGIVRAACCAVAAP